MKHLTALAAAILLGLSGPTWAQERDCTRGTPANGPASWRRKSTNPPAAIRKRRSRFTRS